MNKLQTSVVINRPIETVFAFLTDIEHASLWAPLKLSGNTYLEYDRAPGHISPISKIQQISEGPIQVGAVFRQVFELKNLFTLEATIEVVEYEPPHVFTLKTEAFELNENLELGIDKCRYLLEPVFDATRVTLKVEVISNVRRKLSMLFFAPLVKRELESEMVALKNQAEAQNKGYK